MKMTRLATLPQAVIALAGQRLAFWRNAWEAWRGAPERYPLTSGEVMRLRAFWGAGLFELGLEDGSDYWEGCPALGGDHSVAPGAWPVS